MLSIIDSSKDNSTVLLRKLLQDGGRHGKTSEFHEHGGCCHTGVFLGMIPLIESGIVWDAIIVDKATIECQNDG